MEAAGLEEARRRLWLAVVLCHAAMAVLLLASKVSLAPAPFLRAYALLLLPVSTLLYARLRGMARLFQALEPVVAGLLLTAPILVATYVALGTALPLADGRLAAWDAALGLDAPSVVAAVDGSAFASRLLQLCYASFPFQLMLLPFWLGLRGNGLAACRFVLAYALLCLLASLISIPFPALGTFVHYGIDPAGLANIDATFGFFFLNEFDRLRAAGEFVLRVDRVAGILTFPSVHAGTALLCAWAGWQCRLLRPFAVVLNVGMAASAVTHGGHYVVDVFAGFAVSALAVAAACRVLRRSRQERSRFATTQPTTAPIAGMSA